MQLLCESGRYLEKSPKVTETLCNAERWRYVSSLQGDVGNRCLVRFCYNFSLILLYSFAAIKPLTFSLVLFFVILLTRTAVSSNVDKKDWLETGKRDRD